MDDNSTITSVKATYVWQDINHVMRSKDRFFYSTDEITINLDINDPTTFPTWTYDGSSTGDSYPKSFTKVNNNDNKYISGYLSECLLRPVKVYTLTTPVRDFDDEQDTVCQKHYIVLCSNYRLYEPQPDLKHYVEEPINIDMDKLVTYATSTEVVDNIKPQFGFEQEFFLINNKNNLPYGYVDLVKKSATTATCWFLHMLALVIWHLTGFTNRYVPVYGHQNSRAYYCGVNNASDMQQIVLNHISNVLISMGVNVAGTNVEVAPGQCEIQIFGHGIDACHDLIITRYIITKIATLYELGASFDNIVIPDSSYNGSGCHANFSTANSRRPTASVDDTTIVTSTNQLYGMDYIRNLLEYISHTTTAITNANSSINSQFTKSQFESVFGPGVCERLTGNNETSCWEYFTWSVGERNCSARVPYNVSKAGYGYIEDRRPGANCNPYAVANYLIKMVSAMTSDNYICDYNLNDVFNDDDTENIEFNYLISTNITHNMNDDSFVLSSATANANANTNTNNNLDSDWSIE